MKSYKTGAKDIEWPDQLSTKRKGNSQCSPYQAVTGKIYRLKQHFLPPATA